MFKIPENTIRIACMVLGGVSITLIALNKLELALIFSLAVFLIVYHIVAEQMYVLLDERKALRNTLSQTDKLITEYRDKHNEMAKSMDLMREKLLRNETIINVLLMSENEAIKERKNTEDE